MSTFSGRTYDAKSYSENRPSYPRSLYSHLRKYIGVAEGEKVPIVVDLACGPGEATVALADMVGLKVFGVDPSEVMLAQARERVKSYGSRIDLVNGDDESLTSQFAKHSVDLLCVAEGAHWFSYPDFWHTAHYVLKPGGTLAIWAYYFFFFEGYPESAEVIKEFSLSSSKCGPYWGPGQSRLNTLYSELVIPTTLFEDEERIIDTVDTTNYTGPFELKRENVTVGEILKFLATYSAYHSWKEANPDKEDILEATTKELLQKTKLTLDSKVTVKWETVLLCAKAKALEE